MTRRADIIRARYTSELAEYEEGLGLLPAPAGPAGGPDGDEPINFVKLIHSLLRGRYLLAIGLALICGSVGAVVGWGYRHPMFISTGSIRIAAMVETISGIRTPEQQPLAMYSSFLQLQAMRLRQGMVVAQALENPKWRELGRGSGPDWQRAFRRFLTVGPNGQVPELISISFMDSDKTAAKVGVDCLIDSFYELYGHESAIANPQTVAALQAEAGQYERRLAELTDYIRKEVQDYGTDDLTGISKRFVDQRIKLEETIDQIKFDLAMREAGAAEQGKAGEPRKPDRSEDEIAALDDRLQGMLADRATKQSEVQRLKDRGVLSGHPEMVIKIQELDGVNTRIKNYVKMWNERNAAGAGIDRSGVASPIETVSQLRTRLQKFETLLNDCKRNAAEVGTRCFNVEGWRRELTEVRAKVAGINQRLDLIRIESQGGKSGRITIESYGEIGEIKDSRKKWAVAGFVGGAGGPVALILLWGLIDRRRFRYSDEAGDAGLDVPLLGILPNLPKNLADPEEAAAAAHCVHRIRSLLQISGPAKKVYAVTSSIAGDGKTSLTLSLGLSYAASGSRTLLVDFDMIGGGLTSSLNAKTDHGLGDVIFKNELNGHIVATKTEGLSLLPIGRNDDKVASRLSAPSVRRFLDSVRDSYDVILIDTGPILGSLEAAFVSAAVDGVILVVGRGRQRSHVDRAIEQLRAVGSNVVGLVFNRASSFDFRKSVSSTSVRSVGVHVTDVREGARPVRRLGPIAQTVVFDVTGEQESSDDRTPPSAPSPPSAKPDARK